MRIGRTLLAALISLSVTMLPAAGGLAVKSISHDAMEMSADEPMDDCCPHAANPCDKAMGDCTSMATCPLKCFSFAGSDSSPHVYPGTLANVLPWLESNSFRSQTSSPPFRPPRV
jgi:hypothetical protein